VNEQIAVRVQPLANRLGWFLSVQLDSVVVKRLVMLKDLVSVGIKSFKLTDSSIMFCLGARCGIISMDSFVSGIPQYEPLGKNM
jgi:hypothetical protein